MHEIACACPVGEAALRIAATAAIGPRALPRPQHLHNCTEGMPSLGCWFQGLADDIFAQTVGAEFIRVPSFQALVDDIAQLLHAFSPR